MASYVLKIAAAILTGCTAAATAVGSPAPHDGERDHEYAHRLHQAGAIVSLESVMERAQTIRPGKLLEVELDMKRGDPIYEVELLDAEGRAWELKFDAKDGRFIDEEQEND